ncbi:MAG: YbgA family protein [Erysipelotrichaceae bacterium]|nr:YbgA family protein [Erysipelotrichaceae bacterium]
MKARFLVAALQDDDANYRRLLEAANDSYDIKYFNDVDELRQIMKSDNKDRQIKAIFLPRPWQDRDDGCRESFLVYIIAKDRSIDFINAGIMALERFDKVTSFQDLTSFQQDNKYLLMLFNQANQKKLGRLSATNDGELANKLLLYRTILVKSLSAIPSGGQANNVLLHIFGYFKNSLNRAQKHDFLDILDKYHAGAVPLNVPMGLLYGFAIAFNHDYLVKQTIFEYFR